MAEFTEQVDIKGCEYILNHYATTKEIHNLINDDGKQQTKTDIIKIIKYCKEMMKNNGRKLTKYNYVSNRADGRLFAVNGIQSIQKDIRGILCKDICTDIDMVNCHPTILYYICKENNISCINLTEYIENRDKYLEEIAEFDHINKNDAKVKVLKATNSGNSVRTKSNLLKNLDKELKQIQNDFCQDLAP